MDNLENLQVIQNIFLDIFFKFFKKYFKISEKKEVNFRKKITSESEDLEVEKYKINNSWINDPELLNVFFKLDQENIVFITDFSEEQSYNNTISNINFIKFLMKFIESGENHHVKFEGFLWQENHNQIIIDYDFKKVKFYISDNIIYHNTELNKDFNFLEWLLTTLENLEFEKKDWEMFYKTTKHSPNQNFNKDLYLQ